MQRHETTLVTGGTGFIGRYVVHNLRNHDEQVLMCGTRTDVVVPAGVEYVRCNLLDQSDLERLLRQYRPTRCIHLAWSLLPGEYLYSPHNWQWLRASLVLLELFARYGGQRFVGGGTCFEYASVNTPRQEDNTPALPSSVYAQSKASLSLASLAAEQALGLDCLWARIFYPIGPGDAPHRLFGGACRSVAEQTPFETRIDRQAWDLMDVRDIGTFLAGLLYTKAHGIINIGKGYSETVRQILTDFFKRHNSRHLLRFSAEAHIAGGNKAEKARGMANCLLADTTKLRQFFPAYNFIPTAQSLEDCLYAVKHAHKTASVGKGT